MFPLPHHLAQLIPGRNQASHFSNRPCLCVGGVERRPEVWAPQTGASPGPDPSLYTCHKSQEIPSSLPARPHVLPRPRLPSGGCSGGQGEGRQQSPNISHIAAALPLPAPPVFPSSKEAGSGPGFLMTEKHSAPKDMSKWCAGKEAGIMSFQHGQRSSAT